MSYNLAQPDPVISISGLNVRSARSHILKNISLQIPRNKVTVLLGPSGCGKTTLLKCLNKLTDLYSELTVSGHVYIDGDDIINTGQDLSAIRQKMGLLSQKPYPLPLSIFRNVSYGLKIQGIRDKNTVKAKVEKHLREAGLWEEVKDRLDQPASRLSIGQQQRLCLARGLAVNPEIILADEPTSALDPISSKKIEQLFVKLKKDYTIVLVTHIMQQASTLADHIVFMYLGEVIEQGTREDIFERPKSPVLKEFLATGH
ncbi:phosphate transport system ATP-binding protein [Anseongella ginsenosidimutans]|uniref:Phosphate transport system ATP-binding protein n=1 Tax=Anseongella ginsenosidimutans TaxID=496056 RepID=A0A4V6NZ23_9SPHI|nr:phosphate ABC transporter ATP-binding protein [Anseongella ginsenosidimutans]QEC53651.1 phosphate ABC transporter ATP-binding protein [Anseongella ginsenosidimutans]TCS86099.1 phosphate transport system ATP-binding protein [Anseongella ginsenosidimutans]